MKNIGMFIEKSLNRSSDKFSQLEPCATELQFPRLGLFFNFIKSRAENLREIAHGDGELEGFGLGATRI